MCKVQCNETETCRVSKLKQAQTHSKLTIGNGIYCERFWFTHPTFVCCATLDFLLGPNSEFDLQTSSALQEIADNLCRDRRRDQIQPEHCLMLQSQFNRPVSIVSISEVAVPCRLAESQSTVLEWNDGKTSRPAEKLCLNLERAVFFHYLCRGRAPL